MKKAKFQKSRRALTRPPCSGPSGPVFVRAVLSAPLRGREGAGILCGGLDGKAGPHTSRVVGVIAVGAAARIDSAEASAGVVIRGTKPPPHRRGHGGMIISNTGISSLVIVILLLVVLFCAVRTRPCTEHFKLCQKEKIIRCCGHIGSVVAAPARVVRVLCRGLHDGP